MQLHLRVKGVPALGPGGLPTASRALFFSLIGNKSAKQVVDDAKLEVKPVNTGSEHYRYVSSLTRLVCGDQALDTWNDSYDLGLHFAGHAFDTRKRPFDSGLLLFWGDALGARERPFNFVWFPGVPLSTFGQRRFHHC